MTTRPLSAFLVDLQSHADAIGPLGRELAAQITQARKAEGVLDMLMEIGVCALAEDAIDAQCSTAPVSLAEVRARAETRARLRGVALGAGDARVQALRSFLASVEGRS